MKQKVNLPIIIALTVASLFILTQCAKSLKGSGTELTTVNPGGATPNIKIGQCPYDCTDLRCKFYTSGYCGDPTPTTADPQITPVSSASMTTIITNAFNGLTVDLTELSREMDLPTTIQASDIDFQNLYISYDNSSPDGKALVAPLKTNSNDNATNYAFVLFTNGTCYGKPIFVKSLTNQHIKYFDLNEGLVTTIQNYASADFMISTSLGSFLSAGANASRLSPNASTGCGQAVANCMADAYTNHGWVSVWMTVQTAFIPHTAVAVAATCAVHMCILKFDVCP